jgi:hypothetical protein
VVDAAQETNPEREEAGKRERGNKDGGVDGGACDASSAVWGKFDATLGSRGGSAGLNYCIQGWAPVWPWMPWSMGAPR